MEEGYQGEEVHIDPESDDEIIPENKASSDENMDHPPAGSSVAQTFNGPQYQDHQANSPPRHNQDDEDNYSNEGSGDDAAHDLAIDEDFQHNDVRELRRDATEWKHTAIQRQQEIVSLHAELDARTAEVEDLRNQLRDKDNTIDALNSTIRDLEDKNAKLRQNKGQTERNTKIVSPLY